MAGRTLPHGHRWTDDEFVEMVWQIRLRFGACTLQVLADELGYANRAGVHPRVLKLVDERRLTMSDVAGSIRATDEMLVREPKKKR